MYLPRFFSCLLWDTCNMPKCKQSYLLSNDFYFSSAAHVFGPMMPSASKPLAL